MRFVVAAVGKPRDAQLGAAIREYEARAGRYWPIDIHEVREEPSKAGSADLVREREGERLLAAIPASAQIIACDAGGRAMSSETFAAWMQEQRERARDVAILIGGAFGLGANVRERAALSLSLAPW